LSDIGVKATLLNIEQALDDPGAAPIPGRLLPPAHVRTIRGRV
jgi:hypothetical protein